MKLSGLYWAIVAAGPVSRSWGKNADDRNRITKTSGNSPCTTEARPVRSATAAPIPPKASPDRVTRSIITIAPGTPSLMCTPKISPMTRNQIPASAESAAVPASLPRTIPKREIGAASSRSVKPISMSTASAIPPLFPASRVDWIIAPASMKSRKLLTGGNPGRLTAWPAPAVWIASRIDGKTTIGASNCGRLNVCFTERAPSAPITRRSVRVTRPRRSRAPRARGDARSSRGTRRRASARPGRAPRRRGRPRPAPGRPAPP